MSHLRRRRIVKYESLLLWRLEKGLKFTIWKNSLERYGVSLSDDLVKELLEKGIVPKLPVTKAQTGESCTADLIYNKEKGILELMDMTVLAENATAE